MEGERPSNDRYKIDHLYTALKHVTRFGLAVDVGAHHGIYTQLLAGWFDHVVAYEPHIRSFHVLGRNTQKSENVETLRAAVIERTVEEGVSLWRKAKVRDGNTQGYYVAEHGEVLVEDGVPAVNLDRVPFLAPVDFLKVDVEGAELRVVEGAKELLTRDAPILMLEGAERYLRQRGNTTLEVLNERVGALGYALVEVVGEDRIYARS